jgi:hypothetical protein
MWSVGETNCDQEPEINLALHARKDKGDVRSPTSWIRPNLDLLQKKLIAIPGGDRQISRP